LPQPTLVREQRKGETRRKRPEEEIVTLSKLPEELVPVIALHNAFIAYLTELDIHYTAQNKNKHIEANLPGILDQLRANNNVPASTIVHWRQILRDHNFSSPTVDHGIARAVVQDLFKQETKLYLQAAAFTSHTARKFNTPTWKARVEYQKLVRTLYDQKTKHSVTTETPVSIDRPWWTSSKRTAESPEGKQALLLKLQREEYRKAVLQRKAIPRVKTKTWYQYLTVRDIYRELLVQKLPFDLVIANDILRHTIYAIPDLRAAVVQFEELCRMFEPDDVSYGLLLEAGCKSNAPTDQIILLLRQIQKQSMQLPLSTSYAIIRTLAGRDEMDALKRVMCDPSHQHIWTTAHMELAKQHLVRASPDAYTALHKLFSHYPSLQAKLGHPYIHPPRSTLQMNEMLQKTIKVGSLEDFLTFAKLNESLQVIPDAKTFRLLFMSYERFYKDNWDGASKFLLNISRMLRDYKGDLNPIDRIVIITPILDLVHTMNEQVVYNLLFTLKDCQTPLQLLARYAFLTGRSARGTGTHFYDFIDKMQDRAHKRIWYSFVNGRCYNDSDQVLFGTVQELLQAETKYGRIIDIPILVRLTQRITVAAAVSQDRRSAAAPILETLTRVRMSRFEMHRAPRGSGARIAVVNH